MMIRFLLLLILCLPNIAKAAVTHAEADKICAAYLKNPHAFKSVKPERCACDADLSKSCKCFDSADKTHSYALSSGDGSCAATNLSEIKNHDYQKLNDLAYRNAEMNGFNAGYSRRIVSYNNQNYLLDTHGRAVGYLSHIDGNNLNILCGFLQSVQSWKRIVSTNDAVCNAFEKKQYQTKSKPVTASDARAWDKAGLEPIPQTDIVASADSDLDHDGKIERVLSVTLSSGAGCGCEKSSLVLNKDSAAHAVGLSKNLDLLMKSATCDPQHRWSVVTINGTDYVLSDNATVTDPAQKRSIPANRTLYQFTGGRFKTVCAQKPVVKTVLDRTLLKKEQLNYTPVN